nr:putative RNA-directed DNA polymerase, eukaryota, reverse transcriptase zinc-binding domain protein [Tanacetum cinerariifolium]
MGFGEKWRKWISTWLTSASISVMVNGSPTKEFKMERGLRQGNPLSPLLFLLVAEALQISILEACNKGFYKGISMVNGGANISLLQYVDDALFFGNWSRVIAYNLILILKCFEKTSGLKVNIAKSRLFDIGVSNIEVGLGMKMRSYDRWNEVVNRFRAKLSAWKAKSLSVSGRLTLVKSVLGSLPIYYLSLFRALQKKDPWCGDECSLMDIFPSLLSDSILGEHHSWNSWIPRKVNIYVWRASIDRLATRPNLVARGVNIESDLCALCDASSESTNHCLVVCLNLLHLKEAGFLRVKQQEFFGAGRSSLFMVGSCSVTLNWGNKKGRLLYTFSITFIEPLPVIEFVTLLLNMDTSTRPLCDSDWVKVRFFVKHDNLASSFDRYI